MVVTRTPFRIAIGGGGTDLSSYYSKFGGFWISMAITKYMYISLQHTFTKEIIIKYSEMEKVSRFEDIKHDIVRTALQNHDLTEGFEMGSFADIPSGTGLGSSGSFTVGLLNGLSVLEHTHIPTKELAEAASDLVMNKLKRPDGKQDQYAAAFGGINCYSVDTSGEVTVEPVKLSERTRYSLEDHLALFYTGISRSSEEILTVQKEKTEGEDQKMIEGLHRIKEIGKETKKILEEGRLEDFGEIMLEHWNRKKERAQNMTNPKIDSWYEHALKNGAIGGKLIGAGGGGFLFFYASDREKLVMAMREHGLRHVRFGIDYSGSTVMTYD